MYVPTYIPVSVRVYKKQVNGSDDFNLIPFEQFPGFKHQNAGCLLPNGQEGKNSKSRVM